MGCIACRDGAYDQAGIYISHDNDTVIAKWRGIGVRLEDDVLVTETGSDVLSKDVPKTVEEIEALMAESACRKSNRL